jgi:hypothetical protein
MHMSDALISPIVGVSAILAGGAMLGYSSDLFSEIC